MPPQNHSIPLLLWQEKVCDFNALANVTDLNQFLDRPSVSEYLREPAGFLTFNLTNLAAVEFALIRAVGSSEGLVERVPLPTQVLPQDLRLALAKYDTTHTKPCKTAKRIIEGYFHPSDIFLFTGDLQKFRTLAEPKYESLAEGLEALPGLLADNNNESAELIPDLLGGMWAEYQQLVWGLRLHVMNEATSGESHEDQMRRVIRDFRERWGGDARALDFAVGSSSESSGGAAVPG